MSGKWGWYLRRLSLMSFPEVGFRLKEEIKKRYKALSFRDFTPKAFLNGRRTNWYWQAEEKGKMVDYLLKNRLWEPSQAERLMDHKFLFFGLKDEWFGSQINWHCDYKNKRIAPFKHSQLIDYRDYQEAGDFKYIWELNRHQHLIVLAKAYFVTGEHRYKDEVIRQIKNWIESNPYKKGINWTSALEAAVRLISWSWVWFFLEEIPQPFRRSWEEAVYKHCLFIREHFSKYSSANNHLIGEASGLFVASVVWPFDKESGKWNEASCRILIQELERQTYEDGVAKEETVSYQQFILDFFVLAGLIGEKNEKPFPEKYWKRIEQMIDFLASLMDRNGNIPSIGDSDDGRAVQLCDREDFNPYRSLIAFAAVRFRRGDLKRKAGTWDEKSFWLLGLQGVKEFQNLTEDEFSPAKCFCAGGYFILGKNEEKEGEIKSVFDCGPLGYLSLAAHGHSDALSFTLNVNGSPVLIDPGTYVYHHLKEWRNYFRGTAAHNTLRINRADQSEIGGDFMWLKKAESKLLLWESDEEYDCVKGEHRGYGRFKDPVRHERELFFDKQKNVFHITDRIAAKKENFIEQFFHFSEQCSLERLNSREWLAVSDTAEIRIEIDPRMDSNVFRGSESPILGWKSDSFDRKAPVCTMLNSVQWKGEGSFKTTLWIRLRK